MLGAPDVIVRARGGHAMSSNATAHPNPAAIRTRLPHLLPFAGPGEPVTSAA